MARVFFRTTEAALNNITNQFKLVHPLRSSMQYTRTVVEQIVAENPNADDAIFKNCIDPNDNVHGTGYRDAFLDTPWEEQEEQLAWLLLNNLFAIHEGWVDSIFCERFQGKGYGKKRFVDGLESKNISAGLFAEFSSYYVTNSKRSKLLTDAFFDVYKNASRLDFSKIDNYMLMYRYFKEARNCFMHGNCIASQRLIDAYMAYSLVATKTDLDVTEVPVVIPPVLGQKVHLNIRGVIGFSDFVQRILIICDINLLQTKVAEEEFTNRNTLQSTTPPRRIDTLSTNQNRAAAQISQICVNAGFLRPAWSEELQNYMVSHGYIHR